jgi:excisionase family DNA binding protein
VCKRYYTIVLQYRYGAVVQCFRNVTPLCHHLTIIQSLEEYYAFIHHQRTSIMQYISLSIVYLIDEKSNIVFPYAFTHSRRGHMPEVLSFEEACQFLKLSKPTLYNYVRRGDVPAFKMGRVWKFHRESLDDWLKKCVSEDTKIRSQKTKEQSKK